MQMLERICRRLVSAGGGDPDEVTDGIPAWQRVEYLGRAVLEEMGREWQPIETAPKDGTRVLLYEDEYHYAGEWDNEFPDEGYWKSFCGQYVTETPDPTHWMPLPEKPS